MIKGKFNITIKGKDEELLETMLNLSHSGVDVTLPFLFYALKRRLYVDDFTYYYNLLELKK